MSDRFSYSKLDCFKQCGFKFKLQYLDGNYAYSDNISTEFGTAIHKCEEAIATAIKNQQTIDYNAIKNEFIIKNCELQKKYTKEYFTEDDKSNRNYQDKMYEYLTRGVYRLENWLNTHPDWEIVGIEQRFSFTYDDQHTFNGAIDRVLHNKVTDEYLIQDIKSWAKEARPEDLTTPLQFVVYVLAAKKLWNADPEKVSCQYDLPLVDIYQNGGTKGYLARGCKKINSLFEQIANNEIAPNPSPLCHFCAYCQTNANAAPEYKYLCPYYMHWTRNQPKDFGKENEWQGLEKHNQILESYQKKYNVIV